MHRSNNTKLLTQYDVILKLKNHGIDRAAFRRALEAVRNHIRVIRRSTFYTKKIETIHTVAIIQKDKVMSKLIYLLGVVLSALSFKGTTDANGSRFISQTNNQTTSAVYQLRTPEYLKSESN